MVHKTKQVVIRETGEIQTHEWEEPRRNGRKGGQRGYMFMWSRGLEDLQGLNGNDWKILLRMCDVAEFNTGIVRYTLAEIGVAEGPNAAVATSRAVKRIVDSGVVVKIGRGRVRLNPLYLWKGELPLRLKVMREMNIIGTEEEDYENGENDNG
jgi:hypothetical protein